MFGGGKDGGHLSRSSLRSRFLMRERRRVGNQDVGTSIRKDDQRR